MVKLLLAAGADANLVCEDGTTALLSAAMVGYCGGDGGLLMGVMVGGCIELLARA